MPGYGPVILSDTVGFIRELPHSLISAFHATLEEVSFASVLLHVVDASNENFDERITDVEDVLEEIGASEIPTISVFNKIDLIDNEPSLHSNCPGGSQNVWVSAQTGQGIKRLVEVLSENFRQNHVFGQIRIPSHAGRLRSKVYERVGVSNEIVTETGDCVLDLDISRNDIGWLNSIQEFKDEYWQIKPEYPTKQ